jgi:hypothetical protein
MKVFYAALLTCLLSCYSFKGISIAPEIKSFSLEPVIDLSNNAPATYPNTFFESFTNKVKRETRLFTQNTNPDLLFKCKLNQFEVSSHAPIAGVTSALNRLTITLEVDCINAKDDKQNWMQKFSRFEDFAANANFINEQDRLIEGINKQLIEDIFNKAFSNW